MDFNKYNEDSLKKLNGITMSAREAHMGDFLADALAYFKAHDDTNAEQTSNDTDEAVATTLEFNPVTVQKSGATTIRQLVSEYNTLLKKLEEAGFVVIE